MSLLKYKTKRNFNETPEPAGKKKAAKDKLIFVVQRHHASHLHYDFRLELNGTLKSWAVPKGPSLNPKDKRLAMMVEDHPIDYASFEGDIPAGNYGAGHVDVWDHGSYEPIDEDGNLITTTAFSKMLHAGSIKFRMKGRRLNGDFALVNMKKDEKTWLLIKHRDKYSVDEDYNSENYAKKSSLAYTAERNKDIAKKKVKLLHPEKVNKLQTKQRSKISHNKKFTDYIKPMLAKLHDKPFDDKEWVYEIKWDGYRAIAEIGKQETRLYSRNGLSFKEDYPVVFEELSKLKNQVILDGEIVALDKEGKPRFQLMQQYEQLAETPLCYYVFDCLSVNGKSIEDKTLLERKAILKNLLPKSDIIRYCDHVATKGKAFFKLVKQQALEGMIAKKADSLYLEGTRTDSWLKIKSILTEDAVIAGYTEPRGGRKYFGALVLGIYNKTRLEYIGHTGTGFTDKALKEVYQEMQPLKINRSPFDTEVPVNAPVTWIKPKLVCNLKFSEITSGGQRRHPVFMGMRIDLGAKEVHEPTQAKNRKSKKEKADE
jgi:bifunctional non-homologous end joining protein LigD